MFACIWNLTRLLLEVSVFSSGCSSHTELDGVDVGLALAAALDLDQPGLLQLADQLRNARPCHAHVLGKAILTREAEIVVPTVADEHGVDHLSADRQGGHPQDE